MFFISRNNGFSGQIFFPNMYSLNFNAFYTTFPAFCVLSVDRDVGLKRSFTTPILYKFGQLKKGFNLWIFAKYILLSIWQGACCYYIPLYGLESLHPVNGLSTGQWYLGSCSFTIVIMVVTVQLMLESHTITKLGFWGFGFAIFLFILSAVCMATAGFARMSFFDVRSHHNSSRYMTLPLNENLNG